MACLSCSICVSIMLWWFLGGVSCPGHILVAFFSCSGGVLVLIYCLGHVVGSSPSCFGGGLVMSHAVMF